MTFDEEKFIIRDQENKVLVDIPSDYVRSILGLVAVMIDEEVPALLDRTYVNREESWELIWNVTLKPERVFSGNWSPEDE